MAPAARVEQYLRTDGELLAKFQALVKAQEFQALRVAFDSRFPAHKHFTDVKKLDLLLWQFRMNDTA
jgi:hypothetical protein